MIRVMVVGAAGRMGRAVVEAVTVAADMDLVATVDPVLAGQAPPAFVSVAEAITAASPDVAVDFTHPDVVFATTTACLDAGVHVVVGTTGLTGAQMDALRVTADGGPANLLVAPNFAIGAVLMMRFAAEASRHMQRAEIIELHHDGKVDAPSGTSIRTAEMMEGDVVIHSVRLPGLVAHQEVVLGGHDETLSIRHDTLSRASFMPGVLQGIRAVGDRPGVTLGLEAILFGE
ncbi:MAG: 4-hydroxy-tetrahydrodipicolinate reductase [Thermoleophilia bacterium]|nr:4-hydroxy-tetrahydrodipicolinate reductase [Thermoleophilia bacterium]